MNGDILKDVLSKNKSYFPENIEIAPYAMKKMRQRGINEDLVRSSIATNKVIGVKLQRGTFQGKEENRYKLIFKISNRYYLILVIVYYTKILKVINVIKTSKDMESKWQKEIL